MGRRLGQHFLFDPGILDRIVDALEPEATDDVIEIGPGKGTLTARLAPRVARVVAIEKDPELASELGERGKGKGVGEPWGRVTVVAGDALQEDWHSLIRRPSPDSSSFSLRPSHYKITGNIPYAITSPLIDKALSPPLPALIVFLVQKEVADRVVAGPGNKTYGALSVGVQAVADVERVFVVKAGSFRPPPEVESAVVRLRPRAAPLIGAADARGFRTFVTGLFGQRRKQIARSLRTVADLDKVSALAVAERVGVKPTDRVEVLSPQTLVTLYHEVGSLTGRTSDG